MKARRSCEKEIALGVCDKKERERGDNEREKLTEIRRLQLSQRMNTRVAMRSEVPSYRNTYDYSLAGRHTNKPPFSRNKPPKNESLNKSEVDCKRSSNATSKSSQICKYWIKNLHSWFYGDDLSMLTKFHQHKMIVTGITLPIRSNKLFSCSTDKTLRIWDCYMGECVSVVNLGDEARCLISMGPWVFIGMWNAIKAWNIQIGAEVTLDGPKGHVLSMAICNNTLFAGAMGMDGVIYVWRLNSEANFPFKPLATLNGHTRAVVCLTRGLGDQLCLDSIDHSIKVWDLNILQCTMMLKGHTDVVTSLIFWD